MPSGERAARRRRRDPGRHAQLLGQLHSQAIGGAAIDIRAQHQHRVARRCQAFAQVLQLCRRRQPGTAHLAPCQVLDTAWRFARPVVIWNRHVHRPAWWQVGGVDRLAQGARHVLRGSGLVAPLDQWFGQLCGIDIGQHRFHPDHRAHLLAGGNHQRAVRVPGIGEGAHTIAGTGSRVQVDEGGLAACQCVAIGHADHGAFVQAEDVAEILREALEKRQLVGAGVAEDGGQAMLAKNVVSGAVNCFHKAPCSLFLEFGLLLQPRPD
ncbi:hypothetical protein D3C80_1069400 [compost metagenome]